MATELFLRRRPGEGLKPGQDLYAEGARPKPKLFTENKGINAVQEEPSVKYKPTVYSEESDSITDKMMTTPEYGAERSSPKLFPDSDRPERDKPKWYDYAASIGIPAFLGGLSGEGAVQGGLLGLQNTLAMRPGMQNQKIADWEKDREFGQKERALTADKDLAAAKLGVDVEDKNFNRKLKLKELNLKENPPARPGKIGDLNAEQAMEAQTLVDKFNKLNPENIDPKEYAKMQNEADEAKRIVKFYQMQRKIDPYDYIEDF